MPSTSEQSTQVNTGGNLPVDLKDRFSSLICPITKEVFVDPVLLSCGHIFEKNAIEQSLKSKNTCPCCGQPPQTNPIPVYNLKHLIEELSIQIILEIKPINLLTHYKKSPFKTLEFFRLNPDYINTIDEQGYGYLHYAAKLGMAEFLKKLEELNIPDINWNLQAKTDDNWNGATPVSFAATWNTSNLDTVRFLSNKADPNLPCVNGDTPLILALFNSRKDRALFLLSIPCVQEQINHQNNFRKGALYYAIEKCNDLDVINAILSIKNLNPNLKTKYDETCLFLAIVINNKKTVCALLGLENIDIGITCRTTDPITPTQYAEKNKFTDILELLTAYPILIHYLRTHQLPPSEYPIISKLSIDTIQSLCQSLSRRFDPRLLKSAELICAEIISHYKNSTTSIHIELTRSLFENLNKPDVTPSKVYSLMGNYRYQDTDKSTLPNRIPILLKHEFENFNTDQPCIKLEEFHNLLEFCEIHCDSVLYWVYKAGLSDRNFFKCQQIFSKYPKSDFLDTLIMFFNQDYIHAFQSLKILSTTNPWAKLVYVDCVSLGLGCVAYPHGAINTLLQWLPVEPAHCLRAVIFGHLKVLIQNHCPQRGEAWFALAKACDQWIIENADPDNLPDLRSALLEYCHRAGRSKMCDKVLIQLYLQYCEKTIHNPLPSEINPFFDGELEKIKTWDTSLHESLKGELELMRGNIFKSKGMFRQALDDYQLSSHSNMFALIELANAYINGYHNSGSISDFPSALSAIRELITQLADPNCDSENQEKLSLLALANLGSHYTGVKESPLENEYLTIIKELILLTWKSSDTTHLSQLKMVLEKINTSQGNLFQGELYQINIQILMTHLESSEAEAISNTLTEISSTLQIEESQKVYAPTLEEVELAMLARIFVRISKCLSQSNFNHDEQLQESTRKFYKILLIFARPKEFASKISFAAHHYLLSLTNRSYQPYYYHNTLLASSSTTALQKYFREASKNEAWVSEIKTQLTRYETLSHAYECFNPLTNLLLNTATPPAPSAPPLAAVGNILLFSSQSIYPPPPALGTSVYNAPHF